MLNYFSKFQNRLIALLLVSTLFPVLIVGLYSISTSTNTIAQLSLQQIEQKTTNSAQKVITFLDNISRDVAYLTKTPPIQGIVRARENRGVDPEDGKSSYAAWGDRMQIIFTALMEAKPYYYQISYLNEQGEEMVRVESQNGLMQNIPTNQLKNQENEEFFIETMKLNPGEFYISPVSLNKQDGKIEIPYKPILRYSTPIYSREGKKKGILLANILAESFLGILQESKMSSSQILVLNQDGYYLVHPDPRKEFGFDLNTNEKVTADYPEKIATQLLSGQTGLISEGTDFLASYYTFLPTQKVQDKNALTFVYLLPKKEVFSSVDAFRSVALNATLLSLGLVLFTGIVIVRRIVGLIREMTGVVSAFSLQVLSTIEEQERVSSQQSSAVQETTVTMDELSFSSQKSAEQAEEASGAAYRVLALAGGVSSKEAIAQNYQISLREKVQQIADQILRWNEQVGQIYTIASTVSDLANQTNMLALNAAVEASRAGDRGKGFAVIATEIRKLADQSKQSAHGISTLVADIQKATRSIVTATEEGSQIVESIVFAINDVVANAQTISLNAKEQAIAIQQVVQAMKALSAGAEQSSRGISQIKIGTEKLMDAALHLKAAV